MLTQKREEEIEKMVAGLMGVDFCCNILLMGSELAVNGMKAWFASRQISV